MKVLTLFLLTFLLVAHADPVNWAGTWYNDVTRDDTCCPAGLMTITQDGTGSTTVKGKWDEYSAKCKSIKLSGEKIDQAGTVAVGNTLILDFTSPSGDKVVITLTRRDADNSIISCLNGLTTPVLGGLYLKTDNTKFGDFVGAWNIEPADGTERCCFPDTFDVKSPEDAVYVGTINWKDNQACKDIGFAGQKWDDAHINVVPSPPVLNQNKLLDNGTAVAHNIKKDGDVLTYYNAWTSGVNCNAGLKKSTSRSYVWIIIVAIIVAVVVIGGVIAYFINKKRKERAHGTDTEYGKMVSA